MSNGAVRRRATIHDVAKKAGVSITTVSHSMNGKGVVAQSTRQRVIDTAAELGYSADAIARGLRSHRLGVLGLVIRPLDTLDSYLPEGVDYFMRLAGAAAVEALDRGFGLMLMRDPTLSNAPAIALAADGFIIADPIANDPVIALLNGNGIPLVAVGRDIERPEFTAWLGDGADDTTESVMRLLAERGATRIALVTGTDPNSWNHDSELVYRDWAAERGMEASVYRQDERLGEPGGRAIADLILADGPLPDAVYSLTGRHAAGLQQRLLEAGIRVPEDIMIVAGSDSEQTRSSTPPITSVDLVPEATARAAVSYLVAQLDSDNPNEIVPPTLMPTIRERASTRPVTI